MTMSAKVDYKIAFPSKNAEQQVREIVNDYNKHYANGTIDVTDNWVNAQTKPFASFSYQTLTVSLSPRQTEPAQMQSNLGYPNDAPKQQMQFSSNINSGHLCLQFSSRSSENARIVIAPLQNTPETTVGFGSKDYN